MTDVATARPLGVREHPRRRARPVLLDYPSALVAVFVSALLVVLVASSAPFVTTAVASEALKNKLVDLSPYAAGLEITDAAPPFARTQATIERGAAQRDAALRALAARLPHVGRPVLTTAAGPVSMNGPAGDAQVVLMSRTDALAHLKVLSSRPGPGIWISSITAKLTRARAGGTIGVRSFSFGNDRVVRMRVKGVYRALAYSPPDPYWANFEQDIYSQSLDAPPPPPFAFLPRDQLYRLFFELSRFGTGPSFGFLTAGELPVDPRGLTLHEARSLDTRFTAVGRALSRSSLGRALDCRTSRFAIGFGPCKTSSSLTAAVDLADRNASAVTPPVTLLSDVVGAIALGAAAAAGAFLVRRRRAEAALRYARGTHPLAFAGRSAREALLPVFVGGAAGFALAYGLTSVFAPSGSLDTRTTWSALTHAAVAVTIGLALLVVAATLVFVHLYDTGVRGRPRILRFVRWELPVLGVAVYLLVGVTSRGGLSGGASHHPTLAVFVFPLLLVAAAAGLGARLGRALLRGGRGRSAPVAAFLALRRLAAARGLLVVLAVVSAVALGACVYAEALASSLRQTTIEKAYTATGSDAQVTVAPSAILPRRFPYPITKLQFGNQVAGLAGGNSADVMVVDPATFARALHWEGVWGTDPTRLLDQLAHSPSWPLPVLATTGLPAGTRSVSVQGVLVRIRVLGRMHAFPLMSSGVPLLVTSSKALDGAAARTHLYDPLGVPWTYVLAKGPPEQAMRALESAPGLGAYYPASIETFLRNPDVLLATRTFSFMRTVAIGAAALVLVALLLYLQARQRSQAIASALARRMGFGRRGETLSLALELGAILAFAGVVGGAIAVAAAAPVVRHIDPLPEYAPAPIFVAPAGTLAVAAAALFVLTVTAAFLTSWLAGRVDVSEALRVA
jgi:putative ABC transport system permease protein